MFKSLGCRYPSLFIPMQVEGELSPRLAQIAEDIGLDEKGAAG